MLDMSYPRHDITLRLLNRWGSLLQLCILARVVAIRGRNLDHDPCDSAHMKMLIDCRIGMYSLLGFVDVDG